MLAVVRSGGMMRFTINGREFNAARKDTTVAAGNVEDGR